MGYTISKLMYKITLCDCFGSRDDKDEKDDVDNNVSNNIKYNSYNYDFENIKNDEYFTPLKYYAMKHDNRSYNDI